MAKVLTYHTGTLNWHGYCKTHSAVTPRLSWYVWLIIIMVLLFVLFDLFILKYCTLTLFLQGLAFDFLWMPNLLVFFSTVLSLRHRDLSKVGLKICFVTSLDCKHWPSWLQFRWNNKYPEVSQLMCRFVRITSLWKPKWKIDCTLQTIVMLSCKFHFLVMLQQPSIGNSIS